MVKTALSMSVESSARSAKSSAPPPERFDPENPPDIQLCVYVHTTCSALRSQDEHLLIELEKKFYASSVSGPTRPSTSSSSRSSTSRQRGVEVTAQPASTQPATVAKSAAWRLVFIQQNL